MQPLVLSCLGEAHLLAGMVGLLALTTSVVQAATYCCDWQQPETKPPVTPGAYACVVHRTVGLQGDAKTGERFAGKIKLPDEQSHFTMTLQQRKDTLYGSKFCAAAKPHSPDPNEGMPPVGDSGMRYYSDLDYWFNCKASHELQLSPSKYGAALRGDNVHTFTDHGGWHVFHFFGGLTFVFFYPNFEGGWYLEEGQCQKM